MRGKIRDKRVTSKGDGFKRVELEQRRPYKRDSRAAVWTEDPDQTEDEELEMEEEEMEEEGEIEEELEATRKK